MARCYYTCRWMRICNIFSISLYLMKLFLVITVGICWKQICCLPSPIIRLWCWSNQFGAVLKSHRQADSITSFKQSQTLRPDVRCDANCQQVQAWCPCLLNGRSWSNESENLAGYPTFKGQVLNGEELWELIEGLEMNDLLYYTHLLTGIYQLLLWWLDLLKFGHCHIS